MSLPKKDSKLVIGLIITAWIVIIFTFIVFSDLGEKYFFDIIAFAQPSEEEKITDLDWLSQYASSESDPTLLENCMMGDYFGSFKLGSWSIRVQSHDNGICKFDYSWEMEGGYTNYECKVLTDKIKITNWNSSAIPIEKEIFDNFCKKIKEGNFFLDQKQNNQILEGHIPPLKQMKITHSFNLISCEDGFTLIFKIYPYSPACVKPSTAEKLIQREWGRMEPYSQCIDIEKTRKFTPVPFKNPESPPNGFNFECAREDAQQVGDIFYLKEKPENLSLNQDEVLKLQGIQIHFFQYLNFADSNELTGDEKIQLLQEKIGERSSLEDINGHLGLVVEGCGNCGTKTVHRTDGTTVSSTFPTPNRVEFYDENDVKYIIRSYQPTEILLELARSLN